MKNHKQVKKTATKKNIALQFKKFVWVIPLVTILIYLSVTDHEFINYDDDWMIYENPFITKFSLEQFKALFSTFYFGQYSPFSMGISGFIYFISDGSVLALKIFAVFIHLLNIMLVYSLFNKLFKNDKWAFIAAAVFALHPVQVESVVWLSAVYKIGIFSFFTLTGLISWIKYRESGKILFYMITVLSMILACFSKEQALVFPLYLLLINIFLGDHLFSKRQFTLLPFLLISLIFVFVTFSAVGSRNEIAVYNYPITERIYFLSFSFVSYIRLMIFPFNLSPFYLFPDQTTGNAGYFIFPLITVVLLAFMIYTANKDKRVAFGYMFFIISVLSTFALQIVSVRDTLYADRYLYLGLPAFIFAFFTAIENLTKFDLKLPLLIIILVITTLSFQRIKVFKDSESVWTDAINKNPENYFALNSRGHYYRQKDRVDDALRDYNEALSSKPDYYLALNNRGKIYFDQGKIDIAMKDYNKCLSVAPNYVKALSNRGAAFGVKGQLDNALSDLNKALKLEPDNLDALSNRGYAYYQKGEFSKTIQDYNKYLELDPDDAGIINTLGLCYLNLKDLDKALSKFKQAISINPDQGAFYLNTSLIYFQKADWANALDFALKAKQKGMNVDEGYIRQLQTKQ